MNLIHTLATVLLVASSATGMIFADEIGLPPLPDLTGRIGDGGAGDDCVAEEGDEESSSDEDASDEESDEAEDEDSDSDSSTSSSDDDSGSESGSDSGSSSDEGSSSSSSDDGSESESESSSGSTTDDEADESEGEGADEEAAAECEDAEATDEEEPAENETEEAEPVAEEEPAEEEVVEDPAVCNFHVDEWNNDYLALTSSHEWGWTVNNDVERLLVEFQGYSNLGLGGVLGDGPEVTLTDGRGRTVAHSDSAGYLSVYLERGTDFLSNGEWTLEYESDQPLTDYSLTIDVSCSPQAEEASAEAAEDSEHADHTAEECDDPEHEHEHEDEDSEDEESDDDEDDDEEEDEDDE